jgi:hypothetical protein
VFFCFRIFVDFCKFWAKLQGTTALTKKMKKNALFFCQLVFSNPKTPQKRRFSPHPKILPYLCGRVSIPTQNNPCFGLAQSTTP